MEEVVTEEVVTEVVVTEVVRFKKEEETVTKLLSQPFCFINYKL